MLLVDGQMMHWRNCLVYCNLDRWQDAVGLNRWRREWPGDISHADRDHITPFSPGALHVPPPSSGCFFDWRITTDCREGGGSGCLKASLATLYWRFRASRNSCSIMERFPVAGSVFFCYHGRHAQTLCTLGAYCRKEEKTQLLNPRSAILRNLNFHPREVVSRYRDSQPQVCENHSYMFYL